MKYLNFSSAHNDVVECQYIVVLIIMYLVNGIEETLFFDRLHVLERD